MQIIFRTSAMNKNSSYLYVFYFCGLKIPNLGTQFVDKNKHFVDAG